MSIIKQFRYNVIKDAGLPLWMRFSKMKKRKKFNPSTQTPFNPPLKSSRRLKEIMTRHYALSRYAEKAKPVAWVTSGAPVEILRSFDFYTIYPENHGALCGALKKGPEMCQIAEDRGYHQDLCSYARIDLGYCFSGKTPVGKLPKPDLLFCSGNICQTVVYWYKVLAHELSIPLILFDTPYNFEDICEHDIAYMVQQIEEMIPILEQVSEKTFDFQRFQTCIRLSKETSDLWGEILDALKNRPAPMTIFDAFGHLAPIVSLRGLPVAKRYYEILLTELQDRIKQGIGALKEEKKRLMWDNIAIWYKMRDFSILFAEHGMNFVTATYTNAWCETIRHLDPSHPLESLAKTYSLIILNNNLRHRFNLMKRLIQNFNVDGLVIHSAKSCKPYSIGQYDIKRKLLKELDIPSVVIEADIADARAFSEEQALTRIEAFFETLEARVG
jgi:bcr-type benzoyl-CoA reductase subunit B